MNLYPTFIEDIKITLEIISPVVLIYAAIRALWQLKLITDQNTISRESLAISELREFSVILEKNEKIVRKIKDLNINNYNLKNCEMNEFNLKESITTFQEQISQWRDFYNINIDIYVESVGCANSLEVIATALNKGTAKIDIIEDSMAMAMCGFVEYHAYIYVNNRNSAINLYQNTIDLYKRFKPRVKTIKENIEKITTEIRDIKVHNS